jgi:2-polyprenyl-6-methoxyphenol hydroxylase-like FAD-dependent oxidoreductase
MESRKVDVMIETSVLIVGGGPVGLTLAIDLASRGVDVTVVESRTVAEPPAVKCNLVSARSMEVYRRLGCARKLRDRGLPEDYPIDVASCTTLTGIELSRLRFPSRGARLAGATALDSSWPTPEPSHRINQIFFEPALFEYAASQSRIRILNRTSFQDFTQDTNGVVASAIYLDSGKPVSIACQYLVGCDGAKSSVRKMIGAQFLGAPEIQGVQSSYIRAPRLFDILKDRLAWMYFSFNTRRCGIVIAIDGKETWNVHNFLYNGEASDEIDRDWAIRQIIGVGPEFEYEVITQEDWMGRRMVADKFRDRRVMICGDAGHIWIPAAGYGMNAGIADAANLAWMLAAVLEGWAHPDILSAYEAERQPITDQTSRIITEVALKLRQQRRDVPDGIEDAGPEGEAIRSRIGKEVHDLELQQQCAAGLNFGYFYSESPIIAYDDERPPAYTMYEFTSSSVPGCRAPHFWLPNHSSLYDVLGPYYTLLRLDPTVDASGLVEAAAARNIPLSVLDIATPEARSLYSHKLTLVRPDQHVAWRGNTQPAAPGELMALLSGAGMATASAKTPRQSAVGEQLHGR